MVPIDANAYHAGSGHLVVAHGVIAQDQSYTAPVLHTDAPLVYGARARLWLGLLSYDEGANKYRTSVAIDGMWHRRDLALLLTATSTGLGFSFDADALGLPNPMFQDQRDTAIHTLDTLRWEEQRTDGHRPAELAWHDIAPRWMESLAHMG